MVKRAAFTKNQQGIVLVFFMVILLVMTLIGISAITISRQHEMAGRSQESAFKAYQLARAGISHAASMLDAKTTDCNLLASTIGTQTLGSGQYSVSGVFNVLEDRCAITALGGEPTLASPISLRTLKKRHDATPYILAFGGDDKGNLYDFNSTVWTNYGSAGVGSKKINAIACPSATDCVAVANNSKTASFDGTTWTVVSNDGQNDEDFKDVACIGAGNCYAVNENGKIFHYDGSSFSAVYEAPGNPSLLGIACPASNDCWAVGRTPVVYHYDGISWSAQMALPVTRLEDISCPNSDDCWGVKNKSEFVYYNGLNWTLNTVTYVGGGLDSSDFKLPAISCLNSTDCWAVGRSEGDRSNAVGVFLHYDGISWAFHSALTSTNTSLNDVKCFSENDCWAVGDNGEFYHYDGVNWVLTTTIGTEDVECIS